MRDCKLEFKLPASLLITCKKLPFSIVQAKCCGDVQVIGPSQDEMNCPCNRRPDIWNDCKQLGNYDIRIADPYTPPRPAKPVAPDPPPRST